MAVAEFPASRLSCRCLREIPVDLIRAGCLYNTIKKTQPEKIPFDRPVRYYHAVKVRPTPG